MTLCSPGSSAWCPNECANVPLAAVATEAAPWPVRTCTSAPATGSPAWSTTVPRTAGPCPSASGALTTSTVTSRSHSTAASAGGAAAIAEAAAAAAAATAAAAIRRAGASMPIHRPVGVNRRCQCFLMRGSALAGPAAAGAGGRAAAATGAWAPLRPPRPAPVRPARCLGQGRRCARPAPVSPAPRGRGRHMPAKRAGMA